ncbi:Txe/YoeB family addiction module toxin [Pedobacter sp. L105]|uniref:Txe/YoeB family addiction module toxin n=1 Tax=Pedobacter sp. L105 TaxID=1641871 RepID=UPI00131D2E34|nr:Txe/YoeB family addiction module toxin [Pedobacter sp. L105]
MRIIFVNLAWEDYLYWQSTDKSILKKINTQIKDIQRTPFEGAGNPEPLKYQFSGCWSRRINLEHRLVYKIENDELVVLQCRYHY